MKPKLAAILVISLLTLSIVGTAVAAISQAVSEEPGTSSVALVTSTNQIGSAMAKVALKALSSSSVPSTDQSTSRQTLIYRLPVDLWSLCA